MTTTTETSESTPIGRVVADFTAAEKALRSVVEDARRLKSSSETMRATGEDVASAAKTVAGLALSLQSTTHELRTASEALRAVGPERIVEAQASTREAVDGLAASHRSMVDSNHSHRAALDEVKDAVAAMSEALAAADRRHARLSRLTAAALALSGGGVALGCVVVLLLLTQ